MKLEADKNSSLVMMVATVSAAATIMVSAGQFAPDGAIEEKAKIIALTAHIEELKLKQIRIAPNTCHTYPDVQQTICRRSFSTHYGALSGQFYIKAAPSEDPSVENGENSE